MIRVCCYKGCGVVYGEKEPLSDKKTTHGLCQKHLEISLKALKEIKEGFPALPDEFTTHHGQSPSVKK